jgi:hypothetical protein
MFSVQFVLVSVHGRCRTQLTSSPIDTYFFCPGTRRLAQTEELRPPTPKPLMSSRGSRGWFVIAARTCCYGRHPEQEGHRHGLDPFFASRCLTQSFIHWSYGVVSSHGITCLYSLASYWSRYTPPCTIYMYSDDNAYNMLPASDCDYRFQQQHLHAHLLWSGTTRIQFSLYQRSCK